MRRTRNAGRAYGAALDWLAIAAFLVAVAVPAVMTVASPSESAVKSEFREPPKFPRVALEPEALGAFPRDFDEWFKDVFWMRPKLIRWHNAIKLFGLRVSPHHVIDVGPNGWIFLADDQYVDSTRGTNPFAPDELDGWVDALATADAWCRERGIRFLVLVAPNKSTVYPEQTPARYERVGPTRLDELYDALRARTEVEFLDLRPPLLAAKERSATDLYYPLGTHWNGIGAAAAYDALMRRLDEPEPRGSLGSGGPLPPDFDVAPGGDSWGGKLYLQDLLHQRNPIALHPRYAELRTHRLGWLPGTPGRPNTLVLGPEPDRPTLVFVGDSFMPWLSSLAAPHFSRSFWIWSRDVPVDVIEHVSPNAVVLELVERMLQLTPPDPAGRLTEER